MDKLPHRVTQHFFKDATGYQELKRRWAALPNRTAGFHTAYLFLTGKGLGKHWASGTTRTREQKYIYRSEVRNVWSLWGDLIYDSLLLWIPDIIDNNDHGYNVDALNGYFKCRQPAN